MEILSEKFCVLYVITLYLLWTQQSVSLAQEYIRSSCDAPVVYQGDPANITCNFSVNLREGVKPFRIYRKPFRNGIEDTVLDCHWLGKDRLTCEETPPGYKFNNEVSDNVTLTVLETSLDKMGYYECRGEPSHPQGIERCTLVAEDKPDNPPATRDGGGGNSGFASGIGIGVAITVVIVLLLGGILFLCRRRVSKFVHSFSSRSGAQAGQDVESGVSQKDDQTLQTSPLLKGEQTGVQETAEPSDTAAVALEHENDTEREKEGSAAGSTHLTNALVHTDQRTEKTTISPPNDSSTGGGQGDICQSAAPEKRLRLLIIGKTGTGKSTFGNNILGQTLFQVGSGLAPKTTQVSEGNSDAFQVIDTPDFQELSERDRKKEIDRLKELLDVPPHAVLLAVRCDEFTEKEFGNYCKTTALLGNCFLPQRLVIVFTFGDTDTNIEQMKKNNPILRKVTEAAGERYVIFSKNASDSQRRQLVDIVNTLGSQEPTPTTKPGSSPYHGGAAYQEPGHRQEDKHRQEPRNGQKREYRLLIIGKTGNGRSTVGNTLLGEERFSVGAGMASTTTTVQLASAQLQTDTLTVIETPDFSEMADGDRKRELRHLKQILPTPPDAVLLTIRCDTRYTPEEYQIYRQLRQLLGDLIPKKRLMIAFTFADRLDTDIEEELKNVCQELKGVLKDANRHYILFGKSNSDTEMKKPRDELLVMLRKLHPSQAAK